MRPHSRRSPLHCLPPLAAMLAALPAAAQSSPPPGLPSSAIWQALFGLIAVLALIAVAAWIVRRLPATRSFSHGPLKVISGIALGTRERIVLIEVEDTWLVVGMSPGQMRTLHTLPKGELPSDGGQPQFTQWLRHFADQRKPASTPHATD